MKEFIFNKKDYKTFKNMYEDIAIKLGRVDGIEDYYDIRNYDYDPQCLWEDLLYGFENQEDNKFIFLNFDREAIATPKNYNDYEYDIIFKQFERLSKTYPNNKLEFKMEEQ